MVPECETEPRICLTVARGGALFVVGRGAETRMQPGTGGAPFVVGARGSAPFSSCDPGQSPICGRGAGGAAPAAGT